MVVCYREVGANIWILHSHLNRFSENTGVDEKVERFPEEISDGRAKPRKME